MKKADFILLLQEAIDSPEVQKDKECLALLLEAQRQIADDEDVNLVAAELSEHISLYLMTHRYKAPKQIVDLAQAIAAAPAKHRGRLSIPFWLSLLFNR